MSEIIQLNNNPAPEKRSKVGVVFGVFVFIIALIIGFLGFSQCESADIGSDKLEVYNLHMEVEYTESLGYSATITGTAKNTSSYTYSYASVEFSVYDSSGNNLGTALANINNLGAGETWRFEAMLWDFPSTRPASYKLIDVVTW